uniref:Uncharacterized protein n=1 Tax=Triticum urartu TaxID=4572 RepID=A0A8R7QQA5_TRIUA
MVARAATAASLGGQCTWSPPCKAATTTMVVAAREAAAMEAMSMMVMATLTSSVAGKEARNTRTMAMTTTPLPPMLRLDQPRSRRSPRRLTAKKAKAIERTVTTTARSGRRTRKKKTGTPGSRRAPARKPATRRRKGARASHPRRREAPQGQASFGMHRTIKQCISPAMDVWFLRLHSSNFLKAALASVSDHPLLQNNAGKDMHVSEQQSLFPGREEIYQKEPVTGAWDI